MSMANTLKVSTLTEALEKIRAQAAGHVLEADSGWGRWQTTLRLCDEVLIAVGHSHRCGMLEAPSNYLSARCCLAEGHPGDCIMSLDR